MLASAAEERIGAAAAIWRASVKATAMIVGAVACRLDQDAVVGRRRPCAGRNSDAIDGLRQAGVGLHQVVRQPRQLIVAADIG
jgi:hypothetical protein